MTIGTATDHLGNKYSSRKEMCAAYPVENKDLFRCRMQKYNWSLEKALITPRRAITYPQDHIGERHMANNGVPCEIINVQDAKHMQVCFIDGTISETRYEHILEGNIRHKTLKTQGEGRFADFITKFAYRDKTGVYYTCKCLLCNNIAVLTPVGMFAHNQVHLQN